MSALPLPGFSLDGPAKREIRRIERFGGWCLDAAGRAADKLTLIVNGAPFLEFVASFRPDINDLRLDQGGSIDAGYIGDLILPSTFKRGDRVDIAVDAQFRSNSERHRCGSYAVTENPVPWEQRKRSYDLYDLLSPAARVSHGLPEWTLSSRGCGLVAGVPHFHGPQSSPMVLVQREGESHPYGALAHKLIKGLGRNQLFLDFGAGMKAEQEIYANGVYLDAVQFRGIDIVNTLPQLPFRDEIFSLVISQAVFEHVPDPFRTAQELLRVLKPGGLILIDTAFMQPLHGDPHHYFNMTEEGLRQIMGGFEILEMPEQPHQTSGFSLTMQIGLILPTMKPGPWKDRLTALRNDILTDMVGFEKDVGKSGNRRIAAGVSVLARKPAGRSWLR